MPSSRNQLKGNSPTLAIFSKLGLNATKIGKTGIHFKSDVFAAVAVVDAKAPYLQSKGREGKSEILFDQLIVSMINSTT